MFDSLVQSRRSIRKFQPRVLDSNKIEKLFEAVLCAPSSMGRVPWEFIAVTEQDLLEKLSRSKPHGSSFLKGAPLGVVVCADPQKCDVWIEDVSVASTFLLLAAHDMGLGACWIQIRERMHSENMSAEAYIAQVLSIPPNLKVESIIAIGYPDEQKPLRKRDTLQFEKVHCDMYGRPFA